MAVATYCYYGVIKVRRTMRTAIVSYLLKLYCGLWISHVIMSLFFTWIHKNNWFKKKAIFVRSKKVEIISAFHGINISGCRKKAMSPRHSAYIPMNICCELPVFSSNLVVICNALRSYHFSLFILSLSLYFVSHRVGLISG